MTNLPKFESFIVWKPLLIGWVTLNIDGEVKTFTHIIGCGGLFCDEHEVFLVGFVAFLIDNNVASVAFIGDNSVANVELQGIYHGLCQA